MRISELCEPLFQYGCLLSRSGRRSADLDMGQVRTELQTLIEDARVKAEADPKLRLLYPQVQLLLMIFMDMTIRESRLSFAKEWNDLAAQHGEANGDEKFFDLLDDALRDSGPAASEMLQIFYTCLGLGFSGWYSGRPDHLRKRQREIAARLRLPLDDKSPVPRIVPEAYEHVDTSNLIESPGTSLLGIGVVLIGLLVVVAIASVALYRSASRDLDNAVQTLIATPGGADGTASTRPTTTTASR